MANKMVYKRLQSTDHICEGDLIVLGDLFFLHPHAAESLWAPQVQTHKAPKKVTLKKMHYTVMPFSSEQTHDI